MGFFFLYFFFFAGSIKNYKKFCKILLNEAQQNEVCSMTKKLNNNCEPKSLSLKSKSGHETKLNDINDEFSISIFECLPDDDHEKAKGKIIFNFIKMSLYVYLLYFYY